MTLDWTQAPPWAKYAAMDEDGCWFWYAERPRIPHPGWLPTCANFKSFDHASSPDWTQTLTERPTE